MSHISLVTGATGFIGQVLVKTLLERGDTVRVLVRPTSDLPVSWAGEVDMVRGDVCDLGCVERAVRNVTRVYHLAGRAHVLDVHDDAAAHDDVHVKGTALLSRAATAAGVESFVFVSSLAVYGQPAYTERDETSPTVPATPYGVSKLRAEHILLDSATTSTMQVTIIRPAMVYGAGCKGNLPRLIAMVRRWGIPLLPDAGYRRSLVHVNDLVNCLILAAHRGRCGSEIFVVTDGHPYTAPALYTAVARAVHRTVPTRVMPTSLLRVGARIGDGLGRITRRRMPFDSRTLEKLFGTGCFSIAKATHILGYCPRYTLEDALPDIVQALDHAA